MFPGFSTRIIRDVKRIYKRDILKNKSGREIKIDIKVTDPPRRKYSVFVGSAVYVRTMNDNPGWWLDKAEWDEVGPNCIDRIG